MEKQLAGSHVLDSQYVTSQLLNRDAKEINVSNQDIVRIGNLCDLSFLRKVNLSFNKINSLIGIDQLPQLKELLAYSCQLEDVSHLNALNKLEKLYLQNNCLAQLGIALQSMSKLQELRLDKNKLSKIEHLSSCVSLKKCNLAHNSLSSTEGIRGLQYLLELNLSNNHIKSINSLKGLPQLKELDVSYNQLKSLDGIQYLPRLEILHAEHNSIVHLQMPNYLNAASSGNAAKGGGISTKPSSANKSASELPGVDGAVVVELYLSGNRIKTIKGIEIFQKSLEILDLAFNQIGINDLTELSASLCRLSQLQEIRLYNNPCCEAVHHTAFEGIKQSLRSSCTNLVAIDDDAIVKPAEIVRQHSNASIDSREFHTWEKDSGSVITTEKELEEKSLASTILQSRDQTSNSQVLSSDSEEEEILSRRNSRRSSSAKKGSSTSSSTTSNTRNKTSVKSGSQTRKSSSKSLPDSSTILEEGEQEEEGDSNEENDPNQINERLGLKVPLLTIEEVLTPEQIQEKEQGFVDLLASTKSLLEQTVFRFEQWQKLVTEEDRRKFEEEEQQKKNQMAASPLPNSEKRHRQLLMSKQEELSSKLLSSLEKVLETHSQGSVSELKKEVTHSPLPLPPLPREDLNPAKISLIAEPHITIPTTSTTTSTTANHTAIASKFSPVAEKIASLRKDEDQSKPFSSGVSNQSPVRSESKTGESKTATVEDILPAHLLSGRTLHGSKQKQSDFLISNTFLTKNQEVLHRERSSDPIDFLQVKVSKPPKAKLSYLQWVNHPNNSEDQKESSSIAIQTETEQDEEEEEDDHREVAISTSLYEEVVDPLSLPEDIIAEEKKEVDVTLINKMYQKPHTIGFDSRYGVINDLHLLPELLSNDTPRSIQSEAFGLLSTRSVDETPRDKAETIPNTTAMGTPSARIIRANSAPQKRPEERKASIASEKSPGLEVASPSIQSTTTQSSHSTAAPPRFHIPKNVRDMIQKSYSFQEIRSSQHRSLADRDDNLSSISLEDRILKMSQKSYHSRK